MRNLQVRGRFEPTGRYKYAASVTASLVCRHPARIMLAFRSIDPPALRRGGRPKNNLFDGFNRKASADGSIGKNRRSLQAALRKFRPIPNELLRNRLADALNAPRSIGLLVS
jgi:hypothetical protein